MYILTATERACAALAASASISASIDGEISIYCGIDNEEKVAPAVVISCENATEEFPNSGVWHVKTDVRVKEIASDSSVSSSLASVVFEAFLRDSTKDVLSIYPGYNCYDLIVEDTANSQEGDAWVQTVRLDIICALE